MADEPDDGIPPPPPRDANAHLQSVLAHATSVRLSRWEYPGGRREVGHEDDHAAIMQLVDNLRVDDHANSLMRHCMCVTQEMFVFSDATHVIAELSIQHGTKLRWSSVWEGDPPLRPEHLTFVLDWLASRGLTGPRDEHEDSLRREARELHVRSLAIETMPAPLASIFCARDGNAASILEQSSQLAIPGAQLAAMMLRALGVSNSEWSMHGWKEMKAIAVLGLVDVPSLFQAVEHALLGEDRFACRGAARAVIACKRDIPSLRDWDPPDPLPFRLIMLDVMQRSRSASLRQLAVGGLLARAAVLPAEVVQQRLLQLMRDPHDAVHRRAVVDAAKFGVPAALPVLMELLDGRELERVTLLAVPLDEEQVEYDHPDTVCEGHSVAEIAALALGYARHEPARAILRQRASRSLFQSLCGTDNTHMYAVALALMGEVERLRSCHFNTKKDLGSGSQALQLAAVEAVVRCKGRRGLDMVVGYSQVSHWWEKERVMQMVTGMLTENAAPDAAAALAAVTELPQLAAWLKAHGAAYAARLQATPAR